ncbi:MAG: hypothetical protein AAF480_06560 [Actinomycetota bacterium]
MTRRVLPLTAAALVLLAALVVRSSTSGTSVASATLAVTDVLEISLPDLVGAGDDLEVTVRGVGSDGGDVLVVLDTGYGIDRRSAPADGDVVTVGFGRLATPASRVLLVTAIQGDRVADAAFRIAPGRAIGPTDVYLGPRTVVADAEHFTMIVAVPEDRWGNPVADGTAVEFTVTRADLSQGTVDVETEHLLGSLEIFSGTVAGRTRVATDVDGAGAAERDFLEVADLPRLFELRAVDAVPPADGHTLIRIATDVLIDANDNVMPDGTSVTLDATGVTGVRRIFGQTIDGVAEFTVEAPGAPGSATFQANASGVESGPLELDFPPAVTDFGVDVAIVEAGVEIRVGPVRSVRNSFVPDGTVAVVTIGDVVHEIELLLGEGSLILRTDDRPGPIQVDVLGHSERIGGSR